MIGAVKGSCLRGERGSRVGMCVGDDGRSRDGMCGGMMGVLGKGCVGLAASQHVDSVFPQPSSQ